MKILYINPILPEITLTLLDGNRVQETCIIPRGDDFTSFPDIIMSIIDREDISEIWTLLGPGAFTRMRIVTLTLSTLIISRELTIKGCHFFDTIHIGKPILLANNQQYISNNEDGSTYIFDTSILEPGTYCGYGNQNDFTEDKILIEYKEDWGEIISHFNGLPALKFLEPIYLKEPHITWSKKSMSHS